MPSYQRLITYVVVLLLTACQSTPSQQTNEAAGQSGPAALANKSDIPKPVRKATALPVPTPEVKESLHTVVVNDVPLRDLLFSLARDADLNLDLDGNTDGRVTLNAINQPLALILDRIAENNDLRYYIRDGILRIQKDLPFIRNYQIDYLNITRNSVASVSVSTQISATGKGAGSDEAGGGQGDNNSSTLVKNISEQNFWESLESNIVTILGAPADMQGAHPDIMVNRGAGIIGVRANSRKQKEVQALIDHIQTSSQRQVLIEATIAEVKLSDSYQAGIDWTKLSQEVGDSWAINQTLTDLALLDRPTFNFTVSRDDSNGDTMQGTLSALQTFGDVSVMSSPKIMAMNNQTALLKVVDNLVYFTVDVNIDEGDDTSGRLYTYESEIHTVPVGFVMGVTPFVSETGEVTLNVRPTISRVIGQQRDPNPALAEANVVSEVPVIQVREVESILKVNSGDVAVIGGLMQDEIANNSRGVPGLSKLPVLGPLFRYQDDNKTKTELVIFIKPVVVRHASLEKDFKGYQPFYNNMQTKFD